MRYLLWSNKGHLLLDDGGRVEIPFNFRFPSNWNELIDQQVKMTVDRIDDRLVMRSIEVLQSEEAKPSAGSGLDAGNIYVDQNGNVIPALKKVTYYFFDGFTYLIYKRE